MNPILIQIILAVVMFIAGIYTNKYYYKLQSKETLKQNLYKEKLQIYSKIVEAVTQAAVNYDKEKTLKDHICKISKLQFGNA